MKEIGDIFLTGLFRSGTTLLSRGISVNPEIKISYQPFFPLFKMVIQKFWKQQGYEPRPMGDHLLTTPEYRKMFADSLWQLKFSSDEVVKLKHDMLEYYKEDKEEKEICIPELVAEISGNNFEALFNSAFLALSNRLKETGKNIVGIKEVWCEDFIHAFAKKGIKCIHIIRDPRSIIASRNHGKYLDASCGGQKYPILFIARAWRRGVEICQNLKTMDNYLSLRFEDFLSNPSVEMKKICDFLGIAYSSDMIDFNKYRNGNGKAWRGNIDTEKHTEIDCGRKDRWKEVLTDDEIFLCEFLCSEKMMQTGYEPVSNIDDVDRFLSMTEDPNAAESWLADFGHTLTEAEKKKESERIV